MCLVKITTDGFSFSFTKWEWSSTVNCKGHNDFKRILCILKFPTQASNCHHCERSSMSQTEKQVSLFIFEPLKTAKTMPKF